MTANDPNPGRRAELLRSAYGLDYAVTLAERRAVTCAGTPAGDYWAEVSDILAHTPDENDGEYPDALFL